MGEGFASLTPDQGLCPWTPLEAPRPDPVMAHAPRARHACLPHIFQPGDAPALVTKYDLA